MGLYNCPTTFTRIVPERGCGFILKRIDELTKLEWRGNPTKEDVYDGSSFKYRPGWNSSCWAALVRNGLIETDDGPQKYRPFVGYFSHNHKPYTEYRAGGHYEAARGCYTVRYHLTPKGRGILYDMMARVNKKAPLNTVGSVAEYDAKKNEEEKLFPLPTEEQKQWLHNWIAGLNKTQEQEHDILQKEAVHCAKLAADYAGENQKLRAEKNDLNERLKKLADRLAKLESEIVDTRFVLNSLINWGK